MDPGFVERHWAQLPNLRRMRDEGSFYRLGTTSPPQSPVAWSTFITGLEPAQHGIFDFVHRDPASLELYSSMSRTEAPRWQLAVGAYILPLSPARIISQRQGTPFWKTLADAGIPVTVIHLPTNYPPAAAGEALSGMGTPDLRGTQGTFTFYTDNVEELSRSVSGGRIQKVHLDAGHVDLSIEGAPNTLRRDQKIALANLTVDVDPENSSARLHIDRTTIILKQGEWSDWILTEFPLVPHLSSVRGMFRVFAKQLHPQFELYVSPINVDPTDPALPISAPAGWSRELTREIGNFFTLGIPEDTSALRAHVLTHEEFLAQSHQVMYDERRLMRYSLRPFRAGFLFFYFSSIDQNSHVLWGRYDEELLQVYREIDDCIREARESAPDAELIVMSDHGFSRFERAAHLNAWLRNRGFLTLHGEPGNDTTLAGIDWSSTEAYAAGLNGLYLNLKGREAHGVVVQGVHSQALLTNLREQLLTWRDPITAQAVVTSVYIVRKNSRNYAAAPDLIVGYNRGFRASWQTGVGGTPADEMEDNSDEWIADHCIDPSLVPGVLFLNRKTSLINPQIGDLASLILKRFHLSGARSYIPTPR